MKAESSALLAVEKRVRARVLAALGKLVKAVWRAIAAVIRAISRLISGTEVLSREDVHQALTGALGAARSTVEETTRAGYNAAAQLARVTTAAELYHYGYELPADLPDLGGYLDSLIADEQAAFGSALLDFHDSIRDAYDGVQGDGATGVRLVTTRQAIDRVAGRLGVRVLASSVNAVHRGYSDAQLALYADFAEQHPDLILQKRWEVRSPTPCAACDALDGEIVSITEQFDHTLTAGNATPLKVYRDLHAPPRHPACRCRLVLEITHVDRG